MGAVSRAISKMFEVISTARCSALLFCGLPRSEIENGINHPRLLPLCDIPAPLRKSILYLLNFLDENQSSKEDIGMLLKRGRSFVLRLVLSNFRDSCSWILLMTLWEFVGKKLFSEELSGSAVHEIFSSHNGSSVRVTFMKIARTIHIGSHVLCLPKSYSATELG